MSRVAAAIAAARQSGAPDRLVQAIPYARFMGLSIRLDPGARRDPSGPGAPGDASLIATLRYSDMLIGNVRGPALHGGTLGALLESAAIFQLLWSSELAVIPKIVNITINYLRAARPVDTHARAVVTRHGRRVAHVRVEAWQDDPDRLVALAYAHFLLDRDPE